MEEKLEFRLKIVSKFQMTTLNTYPDNYTNLKRYNYNVKQLKLGKSINYFKGNKPDIQLRL